jgi:uncharacterized membrane protein YqaE (UPF0057 family)
MNKLILIILAIFLPSITVSLKSGAGKYLLINILLCLLFYVPGIIHALRARTKWLLIKGKIVFRPILILVTFIIKIRVY